MFIDTEAHVFTRDEEVLKIIPTGVHHIVEVGGSGTIEKSFASIAFGGCISSIGFVAGSAPREIPNINGMALMKSATLRGILIGSREQFIRMNAQIETNKISQSF